MKLGKVVPLGPGATATVVCGNGYVLGRTSKVSNVNTENERSVGILVIYGGFDYSVCGDLIGQPYGQENANLEEPLADGLIGQGVLVEVLHVNHHGASNGSRPAFIEKLKPTAGIISVGDGNDYNHPTAKTLTTLFTNGVKVYQTEKGARKSVSDVSGSSKVLGGHVLVDLVDTDGQQFSVKNWGSLGTVVVDDQYAVRGGADH